MPEQPLNGANHGRSEVIVGSVPTNGRIGRKKLLGNAVRRGKKEAASMAKSPKTKRKKHPKTVLKLPDLELSKSAVLNSLASASSQRS